MTDMIISWAVHYKRTVLTALVLIFVMGLLSYFQIPRESQPDVPIPTIYISIPHEGISPEDAERLLVRPMEAELKGLEGLKEMRSTAVEGHASIVLEFDINVNIDRALDDVRGAVDLAKAELPTDSEEPIIQEINASDIFPMVNVNISGEIPFRVLQRIARELEDVIEALPEVLEVDIEGEREDVVDIIIAPSVFTGYGIEQDAVFTAASRNNRLVAAGAIDTGTGRLPVKVPGLFEDVYDILELPIHASGEEVLQVQDIAELRKTYKDPESFARVNGHHALTLKVKKRSGENIISAVAKIQAILDEAGTMWPPGVTVELAQDQSDDIKIMLTDLQNNVLSAIALVMIVIVGALGVRSGILVGMAIPGSFLAGIICLYFTGLTLNMIVLFSLIMATGMLVDGAIVVTEFADRKMNEGLPREKAYLVAAQRMALPIIAATATTLLAFMPMLFWPGMVGEFMKYLPLTLIYTLAASLVMALIFLPALGSLIGKPGPASESTMKSLAAAEGGDLRSLGGFTGFYVRTLELALRIPIMPLLLTIGTMILAIGAYSVFGKGVEFFPNVDPEMAIVDVRMRGDMSIHEMDALVREVETAVATVPGIQTLNAVTAVRTDRDLEDIHGILQLEFEDWQQRPTGEEILNQVREATRHIPGVIIDVQEPAAGPPVGKPVQIQLRSNNPEALEQGVQIVREQFERTEGLIEITDTRPVPGIEWQILVDRAEAARYGADVTLVGNAVQMATTGLILASYRPSDVDDEVDIRVRYPEQFRTLDQISGLTIPAGGKLVPVGNFIERVPAQKVTSIQRVDGNRIYTVAANTAEGYLPATAVEELRRWMEENPLPEGVSYVFKGEDEEQAKSMAFLMRAFLFAMFLMAIVLLTQFNSFYHTFLILTAVVFSTIGVFLGLLITHQPFGVVMNGIGVVALAGIVVNNNIVLIDTFAHHRRNGMELREAVMRTGAQRLRPVLLTTITTILGLLPMVFKLNIDFFNRDITYGSPSTQWWTQLSTSIAFGLAFSTLLTLIVTPSLLVVGGQLGDYFKRLFPEKSES